MPGYLGLRGHNPQNPYDRERQRRDEGKQGSYSQEHERRANEKVQEILREQEGDMSAYKGTIAPAETGDCYRIASRPVGDIMSAKVAALSFDDNLLTVQGIFSNVKFRHLPVVDDLGRVIGVISDRDFLRVVSPFFGTINEQIRDREIMARKVGTIMTRKPVCTHVNTSILDAVKLMNIKKISCIPIIDKQTLVLQGIVTWKDIVRAFCGQAFNLPSESTRLKTGVKVEPETTESARLRARRSTRAIASPPPAAPHSHAGEARGRDDGKTSQKYSPPPSQAQRSGRSDTAHITRSDVPHISATEKLQGGYTAGKAGSDLAAKQRASIRKQVKHHKQHPEGHRDDD